jgi:alpha-glucosidase
MPPQWALGFQQSRYSYMSAEEVRQIAGRLRSDRIPTDVIWLDIDFQDRNRPFTVNTETFPDLSGLAREMRGNGIRLVAIADLHVARASNEGYAPYDTGAAGNHFVRNPDGSTYVAPVWPGPSVFPDFTRADTRRWWGGLHGGLLDAGIAGIWNDMNEPAIFETPTKTMPLDTLHRVHTDDFATRDATHAEIHNVYGMENSRATFEGLRRLKPDERAFVMTRASYAGGHRYAFTWTGDNISSWEHLRLSVQQLINLGLSGFSYAGFDAGGFTGGASPELLTRWLQIGAFTPIFRAHSAKGTPRAEPWVDGPEHLAIRRRFIEERYRLMPYLYSLADRNARLGDPIMRPVFYDYPSALTAQCDQSMTFTLGASLLVAPSPRLNSPRRYAVCLPAGDWYDYWTGQPVAAQQGSAQVIQSATQAASGKEIPHLVVYETPRVDHLPVFVRAGTILPRQPLVQSTSETPKGALELHLYPGEECQGELYADDGHSMSFQRGDFLRQTIRCTVRPEGIQIDFGARAGRFRPWWTQIKMVVHNWRGPGSVKWRGRGISRGRTIATQSDPATNTLVFTLSDQQKAGALLVAR